MPNAAPVAYNDGVYTFHPTPTQPTLYVTGSGVLANDTDADLDMLSAYVVNDVSHGSLTLYTDGSFSYTPSLGYTGADSFAYYASDMTDNSNTATVSINVTNAAPVANDESFFFHQGESLNISTGGGLLGNDTDGDNDTLTASVVSNPTHGMLNLYSDGTFDYEPDNGYVGLDSFTYKVNDGITDSSAATVSLFIGNTAPVAANDLYNIHENAYLSPNAAGGVFANDTDDDSDTLSATLVADVSHGILMLYNDGSFNYQPDTDWTGTDSFTYYANDGAEDSDTVTVSIHVGNHAPVASSVTLGVLKNNDLVIDFHDNITDAEGDTLTFSVLSSPSHGSLTTNPNGTRTYTPDTDWTGNDSFTVKANDGLEDSNTATITIHVDNAPTASNDNFTISHDQVLTPIDFPASDADSDPLTYIIVSQPTYGTVWQNEEGDFEYYPEAGWTGTDTFTFKANDGVADSNTATITIYVVNSAPETSNGTYYVLHDQPLAGIDLMQYVTDEDFDYDIMQISIVSGPSHGELTLNDDGTYVYTPDEEFVGSDTFTIQANDGVDDSDEATITIHVTQYAPVAGDGSYYFLHDRLAPDIDFSANNTEANDDPLQIDIVTGPSHGTLTLNTDGTYNYEPDEGWTGTDTVMIIANGGGITYGPFQEVEVTIHVYNNAPVARRTDVPLLAYDGLYEGFAILANSTDRDGETLTFEIVSAPENGSLDLNSTTGLYDYHANSSYLGRDSFSYRYYDGAAYSATVNVDILVWDETTDFAMDTYIQGFADLPGVDFNGVPNGYAIRQDNLEDCWFVAAEVGLAQARGADLQARLGANNTPIIVDNGDVGGGRRYTVTFPRRQSVNFVYVSGQTFTDPKNANRQMRMSYSSENNGNWSAILEQAWAALNRPQINIWADAISQVLDHLAPSPLGISALTGGHPVGNRSFPGTFDFVTASTLTSAFNNNKVVIASTTVAAHGLKAPHAYAVLGYTAETNQVLLYNPHGINLAFTEVVTAPQGGGWKVNRRALGNGRGYFYLPLYRFTTWFASMSFEL